MRTSTLIMVCIMGIVGIVMASGADESVLRIMPLGDSITAGYHVGKGGYRDHLRGMLQKNGIHVDFVGRNVDMSNGIADPEHEGYSGATIDLIAQKADEALPQLKPDIILLFAGTNDIRVNGANDQPSNPVYWKDAPQRFEKLLSTIKRKSPQAIIFVGTLMPYAKAWAAREDAALEYNAKLAEIVSKEKAQGTKIYLVDFRKTVDATDLADGLHPNAKGYEKMAQAWAEAMTTVWEVK